MIGARVLSSRIRSSVLVSLKTGEAFEGVLWDHDKMTLVLRNAQQVASGNEAPQVVDGELLVLFADVAYIQVVR